MLNKAGRETMRAKRSFRIPLAAYEKLFKRDHHVDYIRIVFVP